MDSSDQFAHIVGQIIKVDRKLDKTDERLIAALRHNARASLSDLALQLDLSRTTVRARIERLQARGDILGFSVVLKEDVLRDPVRGLMMIGIEGRGTSRILRQLQGLPEVRAIHTTNRRWLHKKRNSKFSKNFSQK